MKLRIPATAWFIAFLFCNNGIAQNSETPTIAVSGTGEVRVPPDQAVLRFSITSRSTQLNTAVADNDAKVRAVTEYLKQIEMESCHVRTDMIKIRPIFEEAKQIQRQQLQRSTLPANATSAIEQKIMPIGYSARRDISITINDLSQFETIYRGLLERGVNEVNNITFLSSELVKHREEARMLAVRAAKTKATRMAGALDCQLAAVQSVRENSPSFGGANMMMTNAYVTQPGSQDGAIASGMITVSASVNVVFVLKQVEMNE